MRKITYILTFAMLLLAAAVQGAAPKFPTDIAVWGDSGIVITHKGTKSVEIYNPDGSELLRSIELKQSPTGVVVDGDKAYVTTFDSKGTVEIISLSDG